VREPFLFRYLRVVRRDPEEPGRLLWHRRERYDIGSAGDAAFSG
jgi:hypothetical protein